MNHQPGCRVHTCQLALGAESGDAALVVACPASPIGAGGLGSAYDPFSRFAITVDHPFSSGSQPSGRSSTAHLAVCLDSGSWRRRPHITTRLVPSPSTGSSVLVLEIAVRPLDPTASTHGRQLAPRLACETYRHAGHALLPVSEPRPWLTSEGRFTFQPSPPPPTR